MIIGQFTYDADTDSYTGAILTLTIRLGHVRISRNQEPCRDLDFDYWIGAQTPHGFMHFGHAWKVTSPSGHPYLDIFLEDPALAKPITAYLPHLADGTRAGLGWHRPQRRWFGS